jgi:hypothetical protein
MCDAAYYMCSNRVRMAEWKSSRQLLCSYCSKLIISFCCMETFCQNKMLAEHTTQHNWSHVHVLSYQVTYFETVQFQNIPAYVNVLHYCFEVRFL